MRTPPAWIWHQSAALLVGCGVMLAVAGPDLPLLSEAIPGYYNDDAAGTVYLHHQLHRALSDWSLLGHDPTTLVPVGTPLAALHGGNSLEMLVTRFLRLFLDWPGWLSWGALAWLPLNLCAFVPLGLHLWGRLGPTLAVGCAWVLFPPYLGEMAAGRLTQLALIGLPLAVLGFLRLAEREKARFADPLLAGGGWALTAIGYWYYGLFFALLLPWFALHGWRQGRSTRQLVRDGAVAGAWCALIAGPFALAAALPHLGVSWSPSPPVDTASASPVFDSALQLGSSQPLQLRGWLPLIWLPGLALCALRGPRRILWLGAALTCVIFALGPGQQIGDRTWLMPYHPLWRHLPLLDRLNYPGRWLGVGGLFLAIAAATPIVHRWPRASWLLPMGVWAQLTIFGNLPLGVWSMAMPPVWQAVQSSGPSDRVDTDAIIVVPVLQSNLTCRWQPFHGRALLGGMIEDKPWAWPPAFREFVQDNGLLMQLWAIGQGRSRTLTAYQEDLDSLHEAGLGTVLLDWETWSRMPGRQSIPVASLITRALGEPTFQDGSGAVWDLPVEGLSGETPTLDWKLPEP